MRFLADMGVSWRTTEWLAIRGHDVVHLVDEGLERASDSDIVKKATAEERIILTMDLDFAHLLAAGHKCTPSVILFRLTDEGPQNVNKQLDVVLRNFSLELADGAIISVRDGHARARKLPIR